jgi:hypothetical protein
MDAVAQRSFQADADRLSKSVSFKPPPPYSVIDPGMDPTLSSPPSLMEVDDLCALIKQMSATRIGFSLDNKNKLRGAYPIDITDLKVSSSDFVSLQNLLDHPYVLSSAHYVLRIWS